MALVGSFIVVVVVRDEPFLLDVFIAFGKLQRQRRSLVEQKRQRSPWKDLTASSEAVYRKR